MRLVKQLPSEA